MAFSSIVLITVFCFCSKSLALGIQTRSVTQNLYIDNAYHDAGVWGPIDLCPDESFVTAIEVKYNPPGAFQDETAINGIKLYCADYYTNALNGDVSSSVDTYGDWYELQTCSSGFVTGFRANVLAYQGVFTDDVAVEDIELDCRYGEETIPGLPITVPRAADTYNFDAGEWSSFAICDEGSAVCGLETRVDDSVLDDVTAVCDIVLFCCGLPTQSTTAP